MTPRSSPGARTTARTSTDVRCALVSPRGALARLRRAARPRRRLVPQRRHLAGAAGGVGGQPAVALPRLRPRRSGRGTTSRSLSWLLLRGQVPRLRRADQRRATRWSRPARPRCSSCWPLRIGLEPELPAFLYLGAVGVALALIDIDVQAAAQRRSSCRPTSSAAGPAAASPPWSTDDWDDLLRAGARRWRRCTPSTSCSRSSTRPAWASATSSSPACSASTWAGWAGPRSSTGGFLGFLFGGVVGGALMVAAPGRPQVEDPVRPVHAGRRPRRDPVGRRFGRPLPRHRARAEQIAQARRPDRPIPSLDMAPPGVTTRHQPPVGGEASWQVDPPSVSTSGPRACAPPSCRSARVRSPSRSSARWPFPRAPSGTARSSTPTPSPPPSSSSGHTPSSAARRSSSASRTRRSSCARSTCPGCRPTS